jgi:hypothetical protein
VQSDNNSHVSSIVRRGLLIMAPALVGLTLAGCGNDDAETSAATAAPAAAEGPTEAEGDQITIGDTDRPATEPPVVGAPGGGPIDLGSIGRDVIVEIHVVLASDDIARSVAAITADAAALGGGIASSDVNYGVATGADNGQGAYAVLVVKVPPDGTDRLLAGLDDTGTVRSINQSAQDVTEQLVDLDVRIQNARQSVTNVREFMDRTENLSELVTLEGELTRRQTELEQLEAQQRELSERVAFSTITIEVVATDSLPEPEPDKGIADAFGDGWDAFVTVLFAIGYALAVLAPFIVLAAIAGLIVWRISIARRLGSAVATPDLPPVVHDAAPTGEPGHADSVATPTG